MTPGGELDLKECLALAATWQTEGRQVLMDIAAREIENLRVDLDNTDPSQHNEVLAKHATSHAAQKFWKQLTDAVNEAIQYGIKQQGQKPPTPEQKTALQDAAILDATRREPA